MAHSGTANASWIFNLKHRIIGNGAGVPTNTQPMSQDKARQTIRHTWRSFIRPGLFQEVLIPLTIIVLLVSVASILVWELSKYENDVRTNKHLQLRLLATSLSGQLKTTEKTQDKIRKAVILELLASGSPASMIEDGLEIYVTDQNGVVVAIHGATTIKRNTIIDLIGRNPSTITTRNKTDIMSFKLPDGGDAIGIVQHLSNPLGTIVLIQSADNIFQEWRNSLLRSVVLFLILTFAISLIAYAYFSQVAQFLKSRTTYQKASSQIDLALNRGQCGLWDWDLNQGRVFWSNSMFHLLGRPDSEELIYIEEFNAQIHDEDDDFTNILADIVSQNTGNVDHEFRMRHTNGHWIWLRARAELTETVPGRKHLVGIVIDITEQKHIEDISLKSDTRLRDAIETISEAFVLWDDENNLVLCNEKYRQFHGLKTEQVQTGVNYHEIMSNARQPEVVNSPKQEEKSKSSARIYEAQLKGGRWLQINERRTDDGSFVSIGTDISEIKLHQQRLESSEIELKATINDLEFSRTTLQRQARQLADLARKYSIEKQRAETANTKKSEFLANISHELRTPLNAIIGFSEMMTEEVFGKLGCTKYREYCFDIHKSGNFLLAVINDILSMSGLERGGVDLEQQSVDTSNAVDHALTMLETEIQAGKLDISNKIGCNTIIRADKAAINQVLYNILSNAVKFTPENGRITIEEISEPNSITIKISDNGIGIPNKFLKEIGKPFEQVQNQFTKNHKGPGLGLAIARSLVELHHGTLVVASKNNKGTDVYIKFPVSKQNEMNHTDAVNSTKAVSTVVQNEQHMQSDVISASSTNVIRTVQKAETIQSDRPVLSEHGNCVSTSSPKATRIVSAA